MRTKIKQIKESDIGKEITINGWIKSVRTPKNFSFIELNDGSQLDGIQIIADSAVENYEELLKDLTTGTSLCVTGKVVKSPGKEQAFEIHATKIEILGKCDTETYPLQKKRHSFEFLRTI